MAEQQRFAVFDIDGTLIRWQLYHAIVDRLAKSGHMSEETYAKVKSARMNWKQRNGLEAFRAYELELINAYEAMLQTLSVEDFQTAARDAFGEHKDQVYTYTRGLISNLKSQGYLLFAISASPSDIVAMVAQYHDFDDYVGTVYEQNEGHFTGNADVVANKKAAKLDELVTKHRVTFDNSIGVGDSDSDIEMLGKVGRPIAFNPTQKLFLYAPAAGWKIVVERKNMVYELEPEHDRYVLALHA